MTKKLKLKNKKTDEDEWIHNFILFDQNELRYEVQCSGEFFEKYNEDINKLISFLNNIDLKVDKTNYFNESDFKG